MSFEANRSISLTPVAANVINQNRFMSVVAAGEVDETLGGADSVGVSLEPSAALDAETIPVSLLDGAKVEIESGAAVAAGANVMSDATGRAITSTNTPVTNIILGIALSASAAAGEVITVLGLKAGGNQAIS